MQKNDGQQVRAISVRKVEIIIHPDGQLAVNNFPEDPQAAMEIMWGATRAVINYFLKKAYGIKEKESRIVIPGIVAQRRNGGMI